MEECHLESVVWSIEGHGYGHGEGEEEETVDVDDGNWVGRDVGVSIGCGSLWTSSLRSFPVPLLLLLLLLLDGNSHARRGQARLLVCQTAEDVGVVFAPASVPLY